MSRFTYDLPVDDPTSPAAGDLLVTSRSTFRITDARPVDSRVWPNRWRLACTRLVDPAAALTDAEQHAVHTARHTCTTPTVDGAVTAWAFRYYRRGETPGDPDRA